MFRFLLKTLSILTRIEILFEEQCNYDLFFLNQIDDVSNKTDRVICSTELELKNDINCKQHLLQDCLRFFNQVAN